MIRTTHVGSLPRGPELVPLLLARDKGEPYDAAEFDRVVQAAVDEAVAKQVAAGVSIVSDGELGKVGYSTYVIERLSGFGGHSPRKPALDLAQVPELAKKLAHIMGAQEFTRASAIGKVDAGRPPAAARRHPPAAGRARPAWQRRGGVHEFGQSGPDHRVPAEPVLPQPRSLSRRSRRGDAARVRGDRRRRVPAPARLPRPRDEPPHRLPGPERRRVPPTIAANVEALNAATANIPPEAMRMHVCWGNYEGPHDFDIPLETIVDIVLAARPATILFEAANPRHEHEWTVWKGADTRGKILAPGLIDTCSNYIETPELVAQRIERFAGFVGKDRLIASTDCGFGTFAGYGKIDPAVAWKKLAALREGADIADERIG
jgi:5-methyltetrahydropteroyltriglutamate--homocysteine methyltransferase